MNAGQRLPSLDGLRAISLGLVLCVHLQVFSKLERRGWIRIDVATLAICMFFVISGFIITRLLADERERTGMIHLPSFYGRRFFRIFPALLGYLCGLAVLGKFGLATCSVKQLLPGLTFLGNYRYSGCLSTSHLWSLSVEEQFYLLWPFVLARVSTKLAGRLLLLVICATPMIRVFHLLHGADWIQLEWHSESVADSLAMGCLLAIVQPKLHATRIYQRFSQSRLCWLVPVAIVAASWQYSELVYQGPGKTIVLLGITVGMDLLIRHAESPWGRLLNKPALVKLGMWSYSIYLWQEVFTLQRPGAEPYAWFPMNLALSLGAGITSYYLIERPSMRWGRRVMARRRGSAGMEILQKTA
jgi:peptidoglycan/LPS O-acetylase OafA/YrhL